MGLQPPPHRGLCSRLSFLGCTAERKITKARESPSLAGRAQAGKASLQHILLWFHLYAAVVGSKVGSRSHTHAHMHTHKHVQASAPPETSEGSSAWEGALSVSAHAWESVRGPWGVGALTAPHTPTSSEGTTGNQFPVGENIVYKEPRLLAFILSKTPHPAKGPPRKSHQRSQAWVLVGCLSSICLRPCVRKTLLSGWWCGNW